MRSSEDHAQRLIRERCASLQKRKCNKTRQSQRFSSCGLEINGLASEECNETGILLGFRNPISVDAGGSATTAGTVPGWCAQRTCNSAREILGEENSQQVSFQVRRGGAPGKSRTCDLLVRSQTLYPAELRALRYANAVQIDYDTPAESSTISIADFHAASTFRAIKVSATAGLVMQGCGGASA